MNVFRSRKKSIAESDVKSRPSLDNAPPVPTMEKRGLTLRKKKAVPEPKPELNLENVLPSSDDFRTSLLLPNLSARFSMLREMDDPNSKLGKASDDSVLYPRRQSRLGIFTPDGLADIAEVSSLAGSIRPPFANERTHSFASTDGDGYGTDDGSTNGSMMTRAKPGQGNKFFGGRQVIYKVREGASSKPDFETAESPTIERSMGKKIYEDDVALSSFQKIRLERKRAEQETWENGQRSSGENDRSGSPPLPGHNGNRDTSSSTNSHPEGRTSTAATSIVSQPGGSWNASGMNHGKSSPVTTPGLERPTKGKRLYGQGLDQQMMEQQSSTFNRFNSIQKNTRGAPGAMGLSRSTSNLNDRFNKNTLFSPVSGHGSNSPSPASQPAGLGGFDFGVNGAQNSRSTSNDREGNKDTPPMSPMSPLTDPTLAASLHANDYGKATASGAFNKPKTSYNEQQFAQRQLQLQEGRETPPLRSGSRQEGQPEYNGRLRNGSMASNMSNQSSHRQQKPGTGSNSRAPSSASNHRHPNYYEQDTTAASGTYLADNSGSEYGSHRNSPEPESSTLRSTKYKPSIENLAQSTIYEHDDQHPAFRNQSDRLYLEASDSDDSPKNSHEQERKVSMDSPTLGGVEINSLGAGLNDLVKGHLRTHSNASSVYPNEDPEMDKENDNGPWGRQAPTSDYNGRISHESATPNPLVLGTRARQVLEQASALANANAKAHDVLGGIGNDKVSQILGPEVPRRSNESSRGWQEQLKGHNRGASTETQNEREQFANELADRRKLVEEKLRNFTDDGPRPQESSPVKSGPFGLLKKSSRGSIAKPGLEDTSKAAKMLGLNNNGYNGPATAPIHHSGHMGYDGSRPDTGGSASSRDRSIGAERREKFFRRGNAAQDAIQKFNAPEAAPPPPPAPFGFKRSRTDPANQPISYHPAGRSRKYSPPRPATIAQDSTAPTTSEPTSRANSAMGHRSVKSPPAGSYFPPPQQAISHPNTPNTQSLAFPSLDNPRPSPGVPGFSAHTTPPLELPPQVPQQAPPPQMVSPPTTSNARRARKQSVNKQDISEPTFISGTSSVYTVDLPAGASLQNGMDEVMAEAPPVPPINPRRRRVQPTQNLFTAFGGRSPNMLTPGSQSQPGSAHLNAYGPDSGYAEEKSSWDADEDDRDQSGRRNRSGSGSGSREGRDRSGSGIDKDRRRLRKTSSETGMNGMSASNRGRHAALMRES